ncbi:MAG: hypothetical protein HYZ95_01930 [Candidatus Omnitrophica bacterium]|nr:hypothetical protein [Candidatus Omnitrophota bacterium]
MTAAPGHSLAAWMMASRWRAFGALLLTVGAPTAALIFLIFAQVRHSLELQSSYRNTVAARLAAQTVREHLDGLAGYVESAAEQPPLISAIERGDWEEVQAQLNAMVARNAEIDRAVVADPEGVPRADYPHDPSATVESSAFWEGYLGVSAAQGIYVSEIHQRNALSRPYLVAVATPVRGAQGRTIGYLVGQHRIGTLAAWFGRIRPSQLDAISFVLVDQRGGMATAESVDTLQPMRLGGHPLAERVAAGVEGWGKGPHPVTGEPCLISYAPVGTTGWKVLACQPEKAVAAPLRSLSQIIFWLAVVFIAGILLTGFVWLGMIQSHHAQRREDAEALRAAWDDALRANQELRAEIAERRRAERELRTTQMSLIQAAKMESVGRLAAGVAHEVKNPLAVVLQGLDYLERHLPARDENVSMVLQDGREAVRRADRVIRGLLDFSALRDLEMRETDINSVLEQALLLVKHELDKSQVHVVKELEASLPRVPLDRQKMEQVFVNLVMNAIQAMPRGGLLRVRSRFKPAERAVVVELEDTGAGIPEETLPKIFDPFVTLKPNGKGTGLGLTVTKNIVDLHGGLIEIGNRKEGGARVTLLFKSGGARSHEHERA